MANLSTSAAQVAAGTSSPAIVDGDSGEAFNAGDVVYRDATTQKWMKAKNDTQAHAAVIGIALGTAGGAGQRVGVQTRRSVTVGAAASVTVGEVYVLSMKEYKR